MFFKDREKMIFVMLFESIDEGPVEVDELLLSLVFKGCLVKWSAIDHELVGSLQEEVALGVVGVLGGEVLGVLFLRVGLVVVAPSYIGILIEVVGGSY